MFLTKWRPIGLDGLFYNDDNGNSTGFTPAVDISEEDDYFLIKADLPGMSEKEIEVKVHDGVLLLSGKREETREEKEEGGYHRERRYGSFCRQFRLGVGVDPTTIAATYDSGVLSVKLPKKEESKPRQIPIN